MTNTKLVPNGKKLGPNCGYADGVHIRPKPSEYDALVKLRQMVKKSGQDLSYNKIYKQLPEQHLELQCRFYDLLDYSKWQREFTKRLLILIEILSPQKVDLSDETLSFFAIKQLIFDRNIPVSNKDFLGKLKQLEDTLEEMDDPE
jgi:hypothetical protein